MRQEKYPIPLQPKVECSKSNRLSRCRCRLDWLFRLSERFRSSTIFLRNDTVFVVKLEILVYFRDSESPSNKQFLIRIENIVIVHDQPSIMKVPQRLSGYQIRTKCC